MDYFLSKLFWAVAGPTTSALLLLAASLMLAWKGRSSPWLLKASRYVGGLALTLILLLGYTNIPDFLLYTLEQDVKPPRLGKAPDGIIILGGSADAEVSRIWGTLELNAAAERVLMGLRLARRFPNATIILSGGGMTMTGVRLYPEARLVARLFEDFGMNMHRLKVEPKSRNTWENALYSKQLANPKPDQTWIVVTSAWHAIRAKGCFEKVGFPVQVWPVDYWSEYTGHFSFTYKVEEQLMKANAALREYVGIAYYYLAGRMDWPW